jgi:hypothetical protein
MTRATELVLPFPAPDHRRPCFDDLVTGLITTWTTLWERCPERPLSGSRIFSSAEQERHGRAVHTMVDRFSSAKPTRREGTSRIIALVAQIDGEIAAEREACNELMQSMGDAGESFAIEARSFDAALSPESTAQALRNLWVMNSIQILCRRPVRLTPSCFAYSLLYPYTDNLLDDAHLPTDVKSSFVHRLGNRLEGHDCGTVRSPQEEHIWELIRMIEREWPRQRYPEVYESLLAIHTAQRESLRLHQHGGLIDPASLLQLTFAKGGTSVLAHGFLILGSPKDAEARWIFGYGTVLQLIDDLQDLAEDAARGHATVFTGCRTPLDLSRRINRLLAFAARSAEEFPGPATTQERILRRLIRGSCLLLICEAVASLQEWIEPTYAASLEQYSPLSFSSLRALRNRAGDLLTSKSLDMFVRTSAGIGRRVRFAS